MIRGFIIKLTKQNTFLSFHSFVVFPGGKTNHSTHISIKVNPIAQILGPHTLSKQINSNFQLLCIVENAERIVWSSPNGEVESHDVNGTYNGVLDVKNVTEDGAWTCTAIRGTRIGMDK